MITNQKWIMIAVFIFSEGQGSPCRGICGAPSPLQRHVLAQVSGKSPSVPSSGVSRVLPPHTASHTFRVLALWAWGGHEFCTPCFKLLKYQGVGALCLRMSLF